MKTEEILRLNFNKPEDQAKMQKVLRKIKPFSKVEEGKKIPLEMIEKFVAKINTKYAIRVQYIDYSITSDGIPLYGLSIMYDKDRQWIGTVRGCSMYEVFSKAAVKLYSTIKTQDVMLRQDYERELRGIK